MVSKKDMPEFPEGLPFDADACECVDFGESGLELRSGEVTYPFVGQSIWLSPYPPPTEMIEGATGLMGTEEQKAAAFPHIKDGIATSVVVHNLCDPLTGNEWPQWWQQPENITGIAVETLFDLWAVIVNGELPESRKKDSTGGQGGTGTRSTTRKKTRG